METAQNLSEQPVINKGNWRDAYQKVDEANLDAFYKTLELITVE